MALDLESIAKVGACLVSQGMPFIVRSKVLDQVGLYHRLIEATDHLTTNAGYLELSWDGAAYWWDYYDYDVEAEWECDSGTQETRPSAPAPPELRQRLDVLKLQYRVPCVMHTDIEHAPWSAAFQGAYNEWRVCYAK